MREWRIGILDNEVACQLAVELENSDDLALIEDTFKRVLTIEDTWLDEADCEAGLAAAEVIARIQGNYGERNPCTTFIDNWIARNNIEVSSRLAKMAVSVVNRILSERSSLIATWEVIGLFDDWKRDIENLRSRIRV
jgi:hypothetical protein